MTKHDQHKTKNGILHRFRSNRDGIAAVEFALIVPLLLAMYLGTVEISSGITVSKKTARVASTVADLVTQQEEVTKAELNAIMDIGAAIYFPYQAAKPVITIIGVDVDDSYSKGGKVVWSRKLNKGSYVNGVAKGSDIKVPNRLLVDDTFLVKVITDIEYRPVVSWVIGTKTDGGGNSYTALDIDQQYWLRPRLSATVDCTDC